MRPDYEVLIISTGPAGLFTALNLDISLKTLIVERQDFPPHKLCGDLLLDHGYEFLIPRRPLTLFLQSVGPPAMLYCLSKR